MYKPNRFHVVRFSCLVLLAAFTIFGCSKSNDPLLPRSTGSEGLTSGTQTESEITEEPLYVPDEVLIVLTDEAEATIGSRFFDDLPLTLVREKNYSWGFLHRMLISNETSVESMCERLKSDLRIRFAEPNYYIHFAEAPYIPNDPMWESDADGDDDPRTSIWEQWGPAKLGASLVWNDTKGDEDLVVAVLDTGIRFTHEDLTDNIWINIDEVPDDGIDNDDNGWIDDWWGWNCWEGNNIPFDTDGSNWYHGTGCAGVIAGVQDNNIGVSGLAPDVSVMAIRADCGILYLGAVENVVEGWDYAVTNGADIISMSFYVGTPTEILETAAYATWDDGNGPMMIAAAGNNNDTVVKYPAGYDCVIAVSAVVPFTRNGTPHDEQRVSPTWGNWTWGSTYGSQITVAGYGEKYYTTFGSGDDQYWDGVSRPQFNGTSCACPTVAGVTALMMSYHPGHNGNWYRERLEQTADDLHEVGYDIHTGAGRVNAFRAVYGSDRFEDFEDENGFVPLELTQEGIEIYDSLHGVTFDNPFSDMGDAYKFTPDSTGCIEIYLDIFTWGEDLHMALFEDPQGSLLIDISAIENHADSSFEILTANMYAGVPYYLLVWPAAVGDSSTYGLKINYIDNELDLYHEDITPDTVPAGTPDVPFLQLELSAECPARLLNLLVSKHSSDPLARFGTLDLYIDSDESGDYTPGDELIGTDSGPNFTHTWFTELALDLSSDSPVILFIFGNLDPDIDPGSFLYVSIDTYKNLTIEGATIPYDTLPVWSDMVLVE